MRPQENGNALFLILIAVALFAALSFAVTQARGPAAGIDKEKLDLEVNRLLQYVGTIDRGVQRVRQISRCSNTEISLSYDSDGDGTIETNGDDGYYNPNSPTDLRCHVFAQQGGGVVYIDPPEALRDISKLTGDTFYEEPPFLFTHINRIMGVGSDGGATGNDLLLVVTYLNEVACDLVNKKLGIKGSNIKDANLAVPSTSTSAARFIGEYEYSGSNQLIFNQSSGASLRGKVEGCMEETGSASAGLHYYSVLVVR